MSQDRTRGGLQPTGEISSGFPEPGAPRFDTIDSVREGLAAVGYLADDGIAGVVFLAEQTQPVRRKVALKILKPGMDTRQVVARFEAERQALALMDHPNIAHVFDGGATASGRRPRGPKRAWNRSSVSAEIGSAPLNTIRSADRSTPSSSSSVTFRTHNSKPKFGEAVRVARWSPRARNHCAGRRRNDSGDMTTNGNPAHRLPSHAPMRPMS